MRIALFDAKPHDREFFSRCNEKYHFDIQYFEEILTPESTPLLNGFDVLCIPVNNFATAEVIEKLHPNQLKLIALRSTGYDHVDLRAAKDKIRVVRVPEYSSYSVAEYAVAMMLTLN